MRNQTLMMAAVFFLFGALLPPEGVAASTQQEQDAWIEHYKSRYELRTTDQKRTDNRGNGYEDLYGTRNFRTVLHGTQYRGGGNNYYHRTHPRKNENPLPNDSLQNLCEEGFGLAIYLYRKNFETAPREITCDSVRGRNTLKYLQITTDTEAERRQILELIRETLLDYRHGPIYTHCWNGWHASGLISALSLRQFCGMSGEDAVRYWDRNTDGQNTSPLYERIRMQIRDFVPVPELELPVERKAVLCPQDPGAAVAR